MPMNVEQAEDIFQEKKDPRTGQRESVMACLNNAGPQNDGKPFTMEDILKMPYYQFRSLSAAVLRINELEPKPGEEPAAPGT
jgi:hypothetical protein